MYQMINSFPFSIFLNCLSPSNISISYFKTKHKKPPNPILLQKHITCEDYRGW